MTNLTGKVRRLLFGISDAETTFERRGFTTSDPQIQEHLERIGRSFVFGYHAALESGVGTELIDRLESEDAARKGFAYEGAGMALTLLDLLTPWGGRRLQRFLEGTADDHIYMVHIGAGWAFARLKRNPLRAFSRLHPLHRWLVLDGYGFHQGYFHPEESFRRKRVPGSARGYARRAFDQGLGRSLWFVRSADPDRIAETIAGFPTERRSDLWSGIGLASTYAGGVSEDKLRQIASLGASFGPELAQGAAFAAKARERAGNTSQHTDRACILYCSENAAAAALITDQALESLPTDSAEPAFEVWRTRIQARLSSEAIRP